jgi:hypothetical protein
MRWRSTGPGSMPSNSSCWCTTPRSSRGRSRSERWAMWSRLERCGGAARGELADEVWLRGDVGATEELRGVRTSCGGRSSRWAVTSWSSTRWLGRSKRNHCGSTAGSSSCCVVPVQAAGRRCAFQDARHTLTEELGIEPSPVLRALEQAVLVQDPSLEAPPRSPPERPRHNLPAALTSLVGRRTTCGNAEAWRRPGS